jgi:hypothetical protein
VGRLVGVEDVESVVVLMGLLAQRGEKQVLMVDSESLIHPLVSHPSASCPSPPNHRKHSAAAHQAQRRNQG